MGVPAVLKGHFQFFLGKFPYLFFSNRGVSVPASQRRFALSTSLFFARLSSFIYLICVFILHFQLLFFFFLCVYEPVRFKKNLSPHSSVGLFASFQFASPPTPILIKWMVSFPVDKTIPFTGAIQRKKNFFLKERFGGFAIYFSFFFIAKR